MPRQQNVSVENNFVGGLNTESSGLNFPENACTDTKNCVFDVSGKIARRLGFDYEYLYQLYNLGDKDDKAITTYLWKGVAGNGNLTLCVVQIGSDLHFYQPLDLSLSPGKVSIIIDLTAFQTDSDIASYECQFATGDGKLFVVNPKMEPIYITYVASPLSITANSINIKIRDFEGVDDGLAITDTQLTLTDLHKYNLRNQGWGDYSETFHTLMTFYPNNTGQWWLYKNADGDFDPVDTYAEVSRGNSPAPRGYFILAAFNQDRDAVAGTTGIPVVTSGTQRPSAVAFFAGRIFYAGVQADGFNGKIYFSKIVRNTGDYGQAHQDNDPTSETLFDLLPTDGGVISAPDIATVVKLFPMDNNLIVFATNGIWAITGSQGIGFTANDYTVKQISSVASVGQGSFINAGGSPAWWSNEGIYVLTSNQGSIVAQSLTDKKISSFYDAIPGESKKYVKALYNAVDKEVQWLYRGSLPTNVTERYEYDGILVYDLLTQSFSPWHPGSDDVKIIGGVALDDRFPIAGGGPLTKYLLAYTSAQVTYITWGGTTNTNYVDWETHTPSGIDYSSYFITGYKLHGGSQRKFQANYVLTFSDNSEDTAFDLQGIWDYANDRDSNRFSTSQRIDIAQDRFSNAFRKHKIRGHGHVLQLKVTSVKNKPFRLLGWSIWETSNAHI